MPNTVILDFQKTSIILAFINRLKKELQSLSTHEYNWHTVRLAMDKVMNEMLEEDR